jgi:hypothetical protein
MFVLTEAEAAAIRAVFEQRGEFAAAVELRRRVPGITDNAQARECARTIASWKPLPLRPAKRLLNRRGYVRCADRGAAQLAIEPAAQHLAGLEERQRLLLH